MMKRHTFLEIMLVSVFMVVMPSSAHADWSLALTISAGAAKTNPSLGIASGATDGYDQGLDYPITFDGDALTAYFPHEDWRVEVGGSPVEKIHRDIRGQLPQDYYLEVKSAAPRVEIRWDRKALAKKTSFSLYDHSSDIWVDMTDRDSYTAATTGLAGITIRVSEGDRTPPAAPGSVKVEEKKTSLLASWAANTEDDLAGYKLRFGTASGRYERTVDIGNVTNYSLRNIKRGRTYYFALTAYDKNRNESSYSPEQSGEIPLEAGQTYTLSRKGVSFGAGGGTGSVIVTTSGTSGNWTARSNASWIKITSLRGVENKCKVAYRVETNGAMSARIGIITISRQTFTVTQAGK